MQKWEYKNILVSMRELEKECNKAGRDGWELVHVWPDKDLNEHVYAIFKRRR